MHKNKTLGRKFKSCHVTFLSSYGSSNSKQQIISTIAKGIQNIPTNKNFIFQMGVFLTNPDARHCVEISRHRKHVWVSDQYINIPI